MKFKVKRTSDPAAASQYVGDEREITLDISSRVLSIHDGVTPGGSQHLGTELYNSDTEPTVAGSTLEGFVYNDIQVSVDLPAYHTVEFASKKNDAFVFLSKSAAAMKQAVHSFKPYIDTDTQHIAIASNVDEVLYVRLSKGDSVSKWVEVGALSRSDATLLSMSNGLAIPNCRPLCFTYWEGQPAFLVYRTDSSTFAIMSVFGDILTTSSPTMTLTGDENKFSFTYPDRLEYYDGVGAFKAYQLPYYSELTNFRFYDTGRALGTTTGVRFYGEEVRFIENTNNNVTNSVNWVSLAEEHLLTKIRNDNNNQYTTSPAMYNTVHNGSPSVTLVGFVRSGRVFAMEIATDGTVIRSKLGDQTDVDIDALGGVPTQGYLNGTNPPLVAMDINAKRRFLLAADFYSSGSVEEISSYNKNGADAEMSGEGEYVVFRTANMYNFYKRGDGKAIPVADETEDWGIVAAGVHDGKLYMGTHVNGNDYAILTYNHPNR